MKSFVIFSIVVTIIYVIYYTVIIARGLCHNGRDMVKVESLNNEV